jgi:hypothetical protein
MPAPAGLLPGRGFPLGLRPGRASSRSPRLGLAPAPHGGPTSPAPGWAGSGGSGLAGILPRAGICMVFRLGQAGIPWPRLDYSFPGRITPFEAEICLIRDIFLIRHRLQRFVPVLGRLQAQTGTSSIAVCWSWDTPWLRPAYSSSPSQSYPQEEDKTDDMEILKTHTRRRRPSMPRTVKMGQAHDDDTIHSTKYGTAVMTALQYDKTPVVSSATVYKVHA